MLAAHKRLKRTAATLVALVATIEQCNIPTLFLDHNSYERTIHNLLVFKVLVRI